MALGPGKYDDICTVARERAQAEGAIVIIINGKNGNGFSAQIEPNIAAFIPELLRHLAEEFENSFPKA